VLTSEDEEAIDTKLTALAESAGKLAERAYAAQQGGEEAPAAEGGEQSAAADDAVDAEFEEVKEDKAS